MGLGIAILPAVAILVGVAIIVVFRALKVPGKGKALCGNCGYEYSGWTRCPECGLNVVDAGVVTPRVLLRARSMLGVAASLALLCALGGGASYLLAYGWMASRGLARRTWTSTLHPFTYLQDSTQSPARDYSIQMTGDVLGDRRSCVSGEVLVSTLSLRGKGNVTLRIDVTDRRARLESGTGAVVDVSGEFDRSIVKRFYELAGLNPKDSFYERGAFTLFDIVLESMNSAAVPSSSPISMGAQYPVASVPGELSCFGFVFDSRPVLVLPVVGSMDESGLGVTVTLVAVLLFGISLLGIHRRRERILRPVRPDHSALQQNIHVP